MKTIYKYMKMDHIKDAIRYGVYASKIDEVNDPYEFEGIKNEKKFRICTMTNSSRAMVMWSHYGDRHRGGCIEFIVNDICDKYIKKIEYNDELIKHKYLNESELKNNLLKKGKEWAYENEYRAVYYVDDKIVDSPWKIKNKKVFLSMKIKSIIFGCLAEKNKNYINILKYVMKYNKLKSKSKIDVSKLIVSDENMS